MSGTGKYSAYGRERKNNWNVQKELARFEMEYKAKHRKAALKEHRRELFLAYGPLGLFAIWFVMAIIMVFLNAYAHANIETFASDERKVVLFAFFSRIMIFPMIIASVINIISMIIFIIDACKNPNFGTGKKVLWSLLLFNLNWIIFPLYFHEYILYDRLEEEKENYKCVLEGRGPIKPERPFWEERKTLLTEEEAAELATDTYVYDSGKGRMKGKQALVHSFLPLILGVICLVVCIRWGENVGNEKYLSEITIFFFTFAIYNFITSIRFIIMTIYRIDMSTGEKVLWCILLYTFNMFVFPVYWLLRVDKSDLFLPGNGGSNNY